MSNDANVTNNVIYTNGIESFVLVEKSELNQIVKDPVQCELGASHGQKVSVKKVKLNTEKSRIWYQRLVVNFL